MSITRTRRAASFLLIAGLIGGCGTSEEAEPSSVEATSASGATATPQSAPAEVVVATGAPVGIGLAAYTSIPEEMRYYEEVGLDVEVQSLAGPAAVSALLSGQVQFVVGGTTSAYGIAANNPSQDAEVRVIYLVAGNVWSLHTLEGSGIQSIGDLRGKVIGADDLTTANFHLSSAALREEGVDPEEDVEWVPVSSESAAAGALREGQIDAYASTLADAGVVERLLEDETLHRIEDSILDELGGTLGVYTSKTYAESNPDVVVRFLVAFQKGNIFAGADPEAAIRAHWSQFPEQAPSGSEKSAALEETLSLVEATFKEKAEAGPSGVMGYLPPEIVRRGAQFLVENGILEELVDTDRLVDLSFTQEAAKQYERKDVEDQAKNY